MGENNRPQKTNSNIPLKIWISKWRWWGISLALLAILIFEFYEDRLGVINKTLPHLLEISFYIVLLAGLGIVIEILLNSLRNRTRTTNLLDLKHKLSLELASAHDLDELTELIIHFPIKIAPAAIYTSLIINNSDANQLERIGEWNNDKAISILPSLKQSAEICQNCQLMQPGKVKPLQRCQFYQSSVIEAFVYGYCLSLTLGDETVALLHILLPPGNLLTDDQIDIFNNVETEIASAIKSANQQRMLADFKMTKAALAERQRVFRDLHDLLGQNLGYLHLKLDQYVASSVSSKIILAESDALKMRDVADDSYNIVRGVLCDLRSSTTPYLSGLLNHQSRLVAAQSNFEYTFSETGQPLALPPLTLYNIYFVCKEAINNIAKHSGAKHVGGKLAWGERDLSIEISDDGCGFDPASIDVSHHFGLSVMGDRIKTMKGQFDIQSEIGSGTRVKIWLPI